MCLVLVCTLVVGVSPIRAKAAYVPVLSDAVVLGTCILVFGMASGFIPPPTLLMDQVEDVGEAFDYVIDDLVFEIQFPSDSSPDDLDDDEKDEFQKTVDKSREDVKKFGTAVKEQVGSGMSGLAPSATVATLLSSFIFDCIEKGYFEYETESSVTDGYSYYGDHLIQTLPNYDPDTYTYFIKALTPTDSNPSPYICYRSTAVLPVSSSTGKIAMQARKSYSYFNVSKDEWDSFGGSVYNNIFLDDSVIWVSRDLFYEDGSLAFAGSEPRSSATETKIIEPVAEIGAVVEGIKTGALTAADIPIPETVDLSAIFAGVETGGLEAVLGNIQDSAQGLASGAVALSDFQQSITYDGNTEEDNPGEDSGSDSEGNDQITDGTFANYPVLNFLSKLGDLLQAIQNGTLEGFSNLLSPRFDSIDQLFSGLINEQSESNTILENGFEDVLQNGQDIIDSMQDIIDKNQIQNEVNQEIQQEQNNIIEQGFASVAGAVAGGVSSALIPSEGYMSNKLDELCNEFSFAASIADTGKDLKGFLTGLGSVPPVIKVNLGAATGGYDYGGEVVLIDFSFYEPYKPQMDAILSAFLWLWFCWRVLLSLPGIVSGMQGSYGSYSDSGHVGSRGYIEVSNIPEYVTDAQGDRTAPINVPFVFHKSHPGSTAHYNEWVRSRNDDNYDANHRKKDSK